MRVWATSTAIDCETASWDWSVCVAVSVYMPAAENLTVVVEPLEMNCGAAAPLDGADDGPGKRRAERHRVVKLVLDPADGELGRRALDCRVAADVADGDIRRFGNDADRGRGRCLRAVAVGRDPDAVRAGLSKSDGHGVAADLQRGHGTVPIQGRRPAKRRLGCRGVAELVQRHGSESLARARQLQRSAGTDEDLVVAGVEADPGQRLGNGDVQITGDRLSRLVDNRRRNAVKPASLKVTMSFFAALLSLTLNLAVPPQACW